VSVGLENENGYPAESPESGEELVTVLTAPAAATEIPVPAATDEEAVHVGIPPSHPRTCPALPPVRVRAEADEPSTEMGCERERTPEAVRDDVAAPYAAPAPVEE